MPNLDAYQFQFRTDDGSSRTFGILQERAIYEVIKPIFDTIASGAGPLAHAQWPHFLRIYSTGQHVVSAVRLRVFVEPEHWPEVQKEIEERLNTGIQNKFLIDFQIKRLADWWENAECCGPKIAQEFTEYLHQTSVITLKLLEKRVTETLRHEDMQLWTWPQFFTSQVCAVDPTHEDGMRIATLLYVHGEIDDHGKRFEKPSWP